ncbi:uncharacterized protein LOC125532172 [Triticum urartu]|uniref:Uncharacterized protein n=1 Tax=Triticum turgidum subsp. durum TaxID=4567 RepID=A0A9R0TWX3_TRITD|nr:uncharacterized protein LOC125532172 [Triticum urartu]VAI20400.1 unnamed protein product [Triticum turgidum subsp. durum]
MDTERLKRFLIGLVVGLAITALLLVADATRPKKRDDIRLNDRGECVYPMSLSFAASLAQLAFVLAVVSHYTSQNGCCKPRDGVSGSSFVAGIILAIISWSMALDAGGIFLLDMLAVWPGNHGKAPECYNGVEADHHRYMKEAFYRSMFAIFFAGCSSKLRSPPPPPPIAS